MSRERIPYARLPMRPIQLHLLHFWKPSSRVLEYLVPITPHPVEYLKLWLKRANTVKCRSLQSWEATITLTTDALTWGSGGS